MTTERAVIAAVEAAIGRRVDLVSRGPRAGDLVPASAATSAGSAA